MAVSDFKVAHIERDPLSALDVDRYDAKSVGQLIGTLMCATAVYEEKHGRLRKNEQHGLRRLEQALDYLPGLPVQAFYIASNQVTDNLDRVLDPEVLETFQAVNQQMTESE